MPSQSSKFFLDKLYFDCIDSQGNCFVIYWARLKIYFLRISYSGYIFSDNHNKVREKTSLKEVERPIIEETIKIENKYLLISGDWEKTIPGMEEALFCDQGNTILWNCHHPKAHVKINYKGQSYIGNGYAETLTLPVKPWKLPIKELRWGRFISKENSVTWINWKGSYPVNKVYHNGKLYEDGVFRENMMTFNGGHFVVKFFQPTTIRKGKLSGIISKMPWLRAILPGKILRTQELKYKSRATFIQSINFFDEGWALFEIITWPGNRRNRNQKKSD